MAVAEDKLNSLAIVTIGIASVVLLWASIVALQAYYETSFGAEMDRKRAAGKDSELRTLLSEQRAGLRALRRNEDDTVRIPIERASQLVVAELRTGEPESLVPAVGPHDTPTVPAAWGRPSDDARVDAEGDDAAGDGEAEETDGAEDTDAADTEHAEDIELPEPQTAPAPAERGSDRPARGAPADDDAAESGRDGD